MVSLLRAAYRSSDGKASFTAFEILPIINGAGAYRAAREASLNTGSGSAAGRVYSRIGHTRRLRMALNVGEQAPDFKLPASTGETQGEFQLSSYRGKNVVLVFYPLDFTPV
jgi:hypothetical protein